MRRKLQKHFEKLVKEAGPHLNEINRIKRIPIEAQGKQKLIDAYLRSLSPEKRKKVLQLKKLLIDESMKKYLR